MLITELEKISNQPVNPSFFIERSGDIKHSLADVSLSKRVLGLDKPISLSEGLKRSFNYFLACAVKGND